MTKPITLHWVSRKRKPLSEDVPVPQTPIKGRGTSIAPEGRYESWQRVAVDDGWGQPHQEVEYEDSVSLTDSVKSDIFGSDTVRPATSIPTEVYEQSAKSIISRNQSPDVPFEQSINPYYGCEHGCIYCYARPSYAYWGLSPGIDFETKLYVKTNAPDLLERELSMNSYRCRPIHIGSNTDCYQPIEKKYQITRRLLEVCAEFGQPVMITTKSALIERDRDILQDLATRQLVQVFVSCGALDSDLARRLEPRATTPQRRLQTMRHLTEVGVPVGVLVAPIIPALNDQYIEYVLKEAWQAGARRAAWTFLRLPHELDLLFQDWLQQHVPLRAEHVMSLIRQSRGGEHNDSRFSVRMKGQGLISRLLNDRFQKACRNLGFNQQDFILDSNHFCVPQRLQKNKPISFQGELF